MPKDDTERGGLLSKVVRFVRNPGASWSEGEQDAAESSYSKQMLKEMIERKRRNDFVRKREFDMLRKMRRSEVMAGQDPAARPSFFQSSMPSKPDDRASTLKKIDEIEAQMSMQWWKTKHGDASRMGGSTNFPISSQPPAAGPAGAGAPAAGLQGSTVQAPLSPNPQAYARTAPQSLEPATPPAAADEPELEADLDFTAPAKLEPMPAPAPAPATPTPAPAAVAQEPVPRPAALNPAAPAGLFTRGSDAVGSTSGFSPSKVLAIDVDEFAHDPELEEAAIRFANGDDESAEAGLMEVLGPGGARIDHDETWLTLFDLYRATGRQERFESAAIEFAARFGRSAPQWVSLPEAVGQMTQAPAAAAGAPGSVADWTSPSSLGTQSLAAMNAALARAAQPWKLSWAKLQAIEPAAVGPLTKVFSEWASRPVQLRFIAPENLERLLSDATPSGNNAVDPAWWKLRLEVLRVLHRPDEFELVALDYCVTYEVSPPSWESSRCEYKPMMPDGSSVPGQTIVGDAFRDSMASSLTGYGDTQTPGPSLQLASVATVELAGQILGDANEAIAMLDSRLAGADVMVISCARLIRIDFTAAGSLLNWVSARQGEGRQVQFIDVHRLVAAFFNVIGISEHARVIARRD